jgi:hypothetical protein
VDGRKPLIEGEKVLTPLWREFIAYHTTREFYIEVLNLFEDAIRTHHGRPEYTCRPSTSLLSTSP